MNLKGWARGASKSSTWARLLDPSPPSVGGTRSRSVEAERSCVMGKRTHTQPTSVKTEAVRAENLGLSTALQILKTPRSG